MIDKCPRVTATLAAPRTTVVAMRNARDVSKKRKLAVGRKSSRRLPDVLRPHPSWEGVVHYRDSIVAPASAPEASRTATRLHGSSTGKSETPHAVEDVTPGTRGHDAKEAVTL